VSLGEERQLAENPRIEDLRRRLDREPGSRVFAQLAEELRKAGQLPEAVRVARQGLLNHPGYPSARMTLGRALLDSRELRGARAEFEAVLRSAPDNILASRYLAECLEGLGDTAAALARYQATLALAPGDKQLQAKIQELEKRAGPGTVSRPPAPPDTRPAGTPAAKPLEPEEPAPIRLVEVDGPMELTSRYDEATPLAGPRAGIEELYEARPEPEVLPDPPAPADEAPIRLMPVYEQEFELERPYGAAPLATAPVPDVPAVELTPQLDDDEPVLEAEPDEEVPPVPAPLMAASGEAPAAAAAPAVVEPAPPAAVEAPAPPAEVPVEPMLLEPDVIDEEFDVDSPSPAARPRVTFRDIVDESIPPMSAADLAAMVTAAATAAVKPPPAPEPELSSPTLAELYFDQGFFEKAIEVYRRLLQREPPKQNAGGDGPDHDRLRARMREIEDVQRRAAAPAPPPGGRQEAIGRAIARLQDLRTALVARRD
jgi:tetratricopeptide (TPR) repeat protein